MKKRKTRSAKSKRKKVSVPNSDDSGVSSGLEMQKIEKTEEKVTDKLKISINLENVQRFIKQGNLQSNNEPRGLTVGLEGSSRVPILDGSQSDKSRFSFEDDAQSCLDYEPYEEEPEDYVDSPEDTKSPFQPEDTTVLQGSYERNNTVDTDHNNVESIEKFYLGYDHGVDIVKNSQDTSSNNNYVNIMNESRMNLCGKISSTEKRPEVVTLNSNSEEEAADEQSGNNCATYWDEDRNDNVANFSKEDEYIQDEEGENGIGGRSPRYNNNENRAGLFKNAEVNFSGLLNITITRPVLNNIESPKMNPTKCATNDETFSNGTEQYPKPPTSSVITHSTFCPPVTDNLRTILQDFHSERFKRVKWPKHTLDLKVVKITSEDDIFSYSVRGNLNFMHLTNTFSSSHSEVSCMTDPNFTGEIYQKESEIDKALENNSQFVVPPDKISDDDKNRSSRNSFHSQTLGVKTSQLKGSDISSSFEDPLNASHISVRTDGRQINTFFGKNYAPNQTESENIERSSSSSQGGVLRNPLKRPPTRPQRNSIDVHVPSSPCEEDALSILGMSTILEVCSNISQASESNTIMQENDKKEFVHRWLITSEANVNQMLESLCESHFTSNCDNTRCEKSHSIDEKRMKQLSPKKLNELYELAKKKIFWFTHLFDVFLACFKVSSENGRLYLVDMINDVFVVFKGSFIDKTSYISKVVCALQSTGLTLKAAIEYIILRYGTSQTSICDILLFIISKETHLDDHWCLVQKMICCRREKLDLEVVINFLYSALSIYPPNIDLCKKIYYEIFEKQLVDSHKIPDLLWVPFRMAINSILGSRAMNSKGNDSNIQTHSLRYRNFTLPSASFDSDDENRYALDRSIDPFERDLIHPLDSASSGTCSEGLSEFNKSLRRMKYNQDRMYTRDQSEGMHYFYPENPHDVVPLLNRSMEIGEISHVHTHNDSNTIPQLPNDNFTNNNKNTEIGIFNSENKYCYDQTRTLDQDVFKTPCSKILKKRIGASNSRNVILQSNRKSQTKAKTDTKNVYNNQVLNRINKSLNLLRRSATPGSSIALPNAQPNINSRYKCNISLHNLYPDVQINATEITKNELLQLREALQEENGPKFLNILEAYQNAFTIENFILNTLILIKTPTNTIDVFKKFMSVLSAIEDVDDGCLKNSHVKIVVEVLAMNLIYFLEKKGEWELCRNILLRIKMKNWHSLVTSKIFFCTSNLMSHMCRYIYISEILTRAGDFHSVNEIFQLKALRLIEPISEWPYQNVSSDLMLRNQVLELFFDEGFIVNTVAVDDLLNYTIIVNGGAIEGFDIWKLIDAKLSLLLDSAEEHKTILQYLSGHMANYGRYMAKNVLQCYMLFMKDSIPDKESFKLFKICCDKGVYHKYTGIERVIIIRTIMCDFEIDSIFQCFFENILRRRVYPHDFCIELKLPEPDQTSSPQLLNNRVNRSIFAVYASVMNILKLKFKITVKQATIESSILVTESMQHFLPFI